MTDHSGAPERAHLPASAPPLNHGNTRAAWATVVIVLAGGLLSTLAVIASSTPLFWVGLGIVVAGLVIGRVMRMLGMGQPVEPPRSDARS